MLQYLLLAAQAGQMFYGMQKQKRAEREYGREIDESIASHGEAIRSFDEPLAALSSRESYINQSADMDQRMLNIQLEQSRLSSVESSLRNTENLRQTLSAQRAIFAARGQNIGQGPAAIAGQTSLHAYGRDEQANRLNTGFRELAIKGHQALTEINRGYGLEQTGIEKKQIGRQQIALGRQQELLGRHKGVMKKQGRRQRREQVFGGLLNLASTAGGKGKTLQAYQLQEGNLF